VVLVPNPTYPIHSFGFIMSGGVVRSMPAEANEDFMRALDRAVRHSIPKPIALVLNYPANPTAYTATLDFYKEVVKFCKEHDMFILSDLAYAEIYFDEDVPPSVLQVPGAIDITVEFTSMSKTYSMPGWRVGFAVGNERLIAALARVKSYLDYGAFTPIQVAAATALNGDDKVIEEVRTIYRDRRDVMVESFARSGWNIPSPKATMFAWTPIPDKFAHMGSLEFAKLLISETGVGVAPGVGFGEYGDQYVRLALVENEQRIRQAARNIKKFLAGTPTHGNVVPITAAK
jgi:alanine-synthesizing transaminase